MAHEAAKVLNKLAMMDYAIGDKYWVDVTHINHPQSLYVRPIVFREDLEFLQQARDQVDASEVENGKYVIYKSDSLDLNVRGVITKISRTEGDIKCDIKALDYGCDDLTVPLWRLYNPKCEVMVPPLAMHSLLANCISLEPHGWSEEVIEAMKTYIGNERAKMTVVGKNVDQLIIELHNSCPKDIASLLAMSGYTVMSSSERLNAAKPSIPPTEEQYLFCRQVKAGDVLHVRCQSGKEMKQFFVAEVGDFAQYLRDRKEFTDYCTYQKFAKVEDLFPGRGVGLRSQLMSKYERAIVKEVVNPLKVVVQQIDWGDIYEVDINDLKLVTPTMFAQSKAVALYCSAPTINDPEAIATYLFPGIEFLISIKSVGNNFDTPHIVDILIDFEIK